MMRLLRWQQQAKEQAKEERGAASALRHACIA